MASDNTIQTSAPTLGHNMPPGMTDDSPLGQFDAQGEYEQALAKQIDDERGTAAQRMAASIMSLHHKLHRDLSEHNRLWKAWHFAGVGFFAGTKVREDVTDEFCEALGIEALPKANKAEKDKDTWKIANKRYQSRRQLVQRGINLASAILLSHPDYIKDGKSIYTLEEGFSFYNHDTGTFSLPYKAFLPADTEHDLAGEWVPDGEFEMMITGHRNRGIIAQPDLRIPLDGKDYAICLLPEVDRLTREPKPGTTLPTEYRIISATVKQFVEDMQEKRRVLLTVTTRFNEQTKQHDIVKTLSVGERKGGRKPRAGSNTNDNTSDKGTTNNTSTVASAQQPPAIEGKGFEALLITANEAMQEAATRINSVLAGPVLDKLMVDWDDEVIEHLTRTRITFDGLKQTMAAWEAAIEMAERHAATRKAATEELATVAPIEEAIAVADEAIEAVDAVQEAANANSGKAPRKTASRK